MFLRAGKKRETTLNIMIISLLEMMWLVVVKKNANAIIAIQYGLRDQGFFSKLSFRRAPHGSEV